MRIINCKVPSSINYISQLRRFYTFPSLCNTFVPYLICPGETPRQTPSLPYLHYIIYEQPVRGISVKPF
jgi:hypothetical protein